MSKFCITSYLLQNNYNICKNNDYFIIQNNTNDSNASCKNKNDGNTSCKNNTYKRKQLPKSVRMNVWTQNVGEVYTADCFMNCGNKITIQNFECGHIVAVKNGGSNMIDNLKPICSLCNKSMGATNLYEYAKFYGYQINEKLTKN